MKFRLLAVTSIAVVTLAGCGGNGFDTAKANDTIKSDLGKIVSEGGSVEVDCPSDVEYVQNGTFTCLGKVNGSNISYKVSMGAAADKFTYELSDAVINLDKAKEPILKVFTQTARTTWTMDCGSGSKETRVVPVGAIFECSVVGKYNGRVFNDAVRIKIIDSTGNIDWKPFVPSKGFTPREILPKPSPSPTPGSVGDVTPGNGPSEQFITPDLVTPTPSPSKK